MRIGIITAYAEIIRQIGTPVLTMVGGIVSIAKVGGGVICWRRQGATTDASLEARWLSERLAAGGVAVVIGSDLLEVRGHAVARKRMSV